ncbi:ATP-grasp domain-containing protein [Candidatus Altiarchaeota archaeon]
MKTLVGTAESWIALVITRSLGRHGIKVDCASKKKDSIAFHSRYCDRRLTYPDPLADEKAFVEQIISILAEDEYVLPYFTTEETLLPLSSARKDVEKLTHLPIPSHESLSMAADKGHLMKVAMDAGIPCPKTRFPSSCEQAVEAGKELGYPLVMKPRQSSNSRGLSYCKSEGELRTNWEKTVKDFSNPILQEFIPPGGGAYGLEAIYNRDSEVRASFVHKRLREFPITGGPSTLRESVDHPKVRENGERLLSLLGWYGVGMVEFRQDPRDGIPKLMEINPRFWGSLALSVASGVDFPYLLYKMVAEGDIEPVKDYKLGVQCRHFMKDLRHLRHVLQYGPAPGVSGRLGTLASFLRLFGSDLHYDVISYSDPRPFVYEVRELLSRKLGEGGA